MDIAGDRTLYAVFADYAADQPEREWLAFEDDDGTVRRWRYGEFLTRIHQAAHLLRGLGIGAGDRVNLHLGNHPAYPLFILAASKLGATIVPTNPVSTADELAYVLDHSECRVAVTAVASVPVVRAAAPAGLPTVLVDAPSDPAAGYLGLEPALDAQSTAAPGGAGSAASVLEVMYTSGTTARPKGVMLTNTNFVYGAEVFRAATGLRTEDRHLIALPLFHAGAQCHALWPALIAGASVVILARFHASRFFAQAEHHEATMAALFGASLRLLLNQPPRPTDATHRLRNVTFAQNLTSDQYAEWHRRFRVPLQQLWGMTETGGLPVMSPLTGPRRLLAMGRPVLGYWVKVVDAAGAAVAAGEPGQLMVQGQPGRSLMLGYLKNAAATAEVLRSGPDGYWLATGDVVWADPDGFLYFLDRGKDLIKRAGENVSTGEVEGVLLDCPGVLDACVVGVPDPLRDEAVVAVVVRRAGADLTPDAVRTFCAARLASFKVPERVALVDALPRTSVGKIQKAVVRRWLESVSDEP